MFFLLLEKVKISSRDIRQPCTQKASLCFSRRLIGVFRRDNLVTQLQACSERARSHSKLIMDIE